MKEKQKKAACGLCVNLVVNNYANPPCMPLGFKPSWTAILYTSVTWTLPYAYAIRSI